MKIETKDTGGYEVKRNHRGYRVGESHHRAKLTDDDVRLVRALHNEGLGYGTIARKFDSAPSTIRDIVTFRTRMI